MPDKTITFYQPVSSDVQTINIVVDNGVADIVDVKFIIRTTDPEDSTKMRQFQVKVNTLSAQRQADIALLVNAVVNAITNKYGF